MANLYCEVDNYWLQSEVATTPSNQRFSFTGSLLCSLQKKKANSSVKKKIIFFLPSEALMELHGESDQYGNLSSPFNRFNKPNSRISV